MPPLEYIGGGGKTNATGKGTVSNGCKQESQPKHKVGDKVVLRGLNKANMNGKTAVVLSEMNAAGQLMVKLDDGRQKLSLRPENVLAAQQEEDHDGDASDSSMPPLEYVGK
eukprot:3712217-Amphidinium_carterae.3